MTDPKTTIEKITRQIKNPTNAAFLEQVEQTGHLNDIKEGLKPTTKVTSFVQHFLDEVTPKRGEDYLTDEEMKSIKDELTPVYKKDYLTDEEVAKIKEEITPVKGTHYNDGEPGHTPTEEELLNLITPLIPEPIPGEPGADADEERIISAVLAKIPVPKDGKNPKVSEVVKAVLQHLGSLKGNDRPSLKMFREADDLIGSVALHKNMLHNMPKSLIDGDQRWHGGGMTSSTFIANEVAGGSVNTFTIANLPTTGTVQVYGQGQRLSIARGDYIISNQTITTTNPWNTGDIEVSYVLFGN